MPWGPAPWAQMPWASPRAARALRVLVRGAGFVALAWGIAIALAAVLHRRLLYPAPAVAAEVPSAALRLHHASDGTEVRALHFDGPPGARVVVHFHGNGETVGDGVSFAKALVAHGLSVVLVEYRGYGVSKDAGAPTESGLYADAEAVLDALSREGVARERVVLSGYSLGSGVAAEMAARGRGRALVLAAPYTSIPDVAARVVPWLPTRLVVRDRYATAEKAKAIAVPTLIVHGDADEVVPYAMGVALAALFPNVTFHAVPGATHAGLFGHVDAFDALVRHARDA